MTKTCLILLALATFPASAQPVYKCSSTQGVTRYQSTPCEAGETSARRQHAPASMGTNGPAPNPTAVTVIPGQRRVQVRYTTTAGNEQCDGAKAMRTAALAAAGAQATPSMRAGLDRDVQNACR